MIAFLLLPEGASEGTDCRHSGTFVKVWKTQGRMTPLAKVDLPPENILFLTPLEIGRRGQFYFGLSVFEGFELADTFTGKGDAVGSVDNAVEYGIGHSRVTDRIVPVQFGKLGCYDD